MELSAGNGIVGVRLSEFVMTRFASKASTSGRGLLTFIQSFELLFSVRALLRLSPPPWTVEELEACFVVTDNAVQKLAYKYRFQCPTKQPCSPGLLPPKVFETRWRQLSISYCVLNVFVSEVRLQRPRVVASVGECVATGKPQHVRMRL